MAYEPGTAIITCAAMAVKSVVLGRGVPSFEFLHAPRLRKS